MLQLDNTTKGKQMLTPEQVQAQDQQIKQLPTIKQLQAKDDEIIEDLESLRAGQVEIDKKVDSGFEKGRKRMDGIEAEVREVKDELKSLKEVLVSFITQSQANHQEIKSEIQNGKIQELREELKNRQKEDDKKSAFKNGLLIGLSVLGAGTVLSLIGYLLTKAYG